MANVPDRGDEPDLPTLVRGIVHDAETLIGQQFELFRSEVRQELGQAGGAALVMGSGAVLMAAGGAFAALMAVHGLHRATRLPLWACYGVLGGVLGGVGFELVAAGRRRVGGVPLMPMQTVEALKENIAWLKDQAIPGAT